MKIITLEDIEKAPALVQFLWSAQLTNTPIGIGMFDKALKDHPEYFPEEIKARDKWEAVSKEVKDRYYEESSNLFTELRNKLHCQKGIFWRMENPKEAEKCDQLDKPLWDQFHKKQIIT